jgi:hypothetical protein
MNANKPNYSAAELLAIAGCQKAFMWFLPLFFTLCIGRTHSIGIFIVLFQLSCLVFICRFAALVKEPAFMYLLLVPLALIPLANMIAVLLINSRANAILKTQGLQIGFLGANNLDLQKLKQEAVPLAGLAGYSDDEICRAEQYRNYIILTGVLTLFGCPVIALFAATLFFKNMEAGTPHVLPVKTLFMVAGLGLTAWLCSKLAKCLRHTRPWLYALWLLAPTIGLCGLYLCGLLTWLLDLKGVTSIFSWLGLLLLLSSPIVFLFSFLQLNRQVQQALDTRRRRSP